MAGTTMAKLLKTCVLALGGCALGAASLPAAPDTAALTDRQRHDIRCAAAFAVVSVAQTSGDATALALPPLGIRGKRYLGQIGETVAAQTGLSGEAMHAMFDDAARRAAHDGAPAIATACLPDLDVAVPPRPAPDAIACVGLLGAYAEVLAGRGDPGALGRTLAEEAARLMPAAKALMVKQGLDSAAQAATIGQARETARAALSGGPGEIDADAFAQCRRLTASTPAPR